MPAPVDAMLRLMLTPGLGRRSVAKLLAAFGGAENALASSAGEWVLRAGLPRERHRQAHSAGTDREVERVKLACERLDIVIVTWDAAGYPSVLRPIPDPPPILYLRGRLPSAVDLDRAVAIVGTRKASNHGLSFAYRIAADLAALGAVVISGLAMGIDAEAHRAVVDGGGVGVAVLAGGLDAVHPPLNRGLAERLLERGCLVSEQPPGTSLRKGHFVARNRIVSGLARAVVVIEAPERSGALTTVDHALDQGRTVFVMPGRPGDPRVAGGLTLLRDGAPPVLSAAEVAVELGLEEPASANRGFPVELGGREAFASGSASFDGMLGASGLTAAELLAALGRLELDGRVRRGSDGRYYLIERWPE